MVRYQRGRLTAATGLLAIALSCVGTEVGNPQDAEVSLEFQGVVASSSTALTLASGIELREAWFVFEEIEIKGGADCDEEAETEFAGVNVVDFISGAQYPGYDLSLIEPGSYCQVNLHIESFEIDDLPRQAPSELADLTILIRGQRSDGKHFELSTGSGEALVLEGAFELMAGREKLFVAFAVNQWLLEEELNEAEGDEMIYINSDDNPEIFAEFIGRLESTALLLRDENQDGVLQPSEVDAPLARGR